MLTYKRSLFFATNVRQSRVFECSLQYADTVLNFIEKLDFPHSLLTVTNQKKITVPIATFRIKQFYNIA